MCVDSISCECQNENDPQFNDNFDDVGEILDHLLCDLDDFPSGALEATVLSW